MHARNALVAHLRDSIFASAEELGEPAKESKEELDDRHHRVSTQVVLAFTGLAELFPTTPATSSGAVRGSAAASQSVPATGISQLSVGSSVPTSEESLAASSEERESIVKALIAVWEDAGFWKRALQDDKPAVFNAGCHLMSQFVKLHNDTAQRIGATLAPLIFSSLQSAPEACQNAAWSMALRFSAACPGGLAVPAVSGSLPKQFSSTLKAGCIGPAFASGIMPLTLQMLRHGPSDWADGGLSELWVPAALKGFQSAPAAAQSRAAEVLAGLLLVMVSSASHTAQPAAELAAAVITKATASSNASTFVKALWEGAIS